MTCYALALPEGHSFSFLRHDDGSVRTFDTEEEAKSERDLEDMSEGLYIARIVIEDA